MGPVVALRPPGRPPSDGVVQLRLWHPDDLDQMVAGMGDPDIARWTLVPDPYTLADGEAWISSCSDQWLRGDAAPFAIVDDQDPRRVLGTTGFFVRTPAIGHAGYATFVHAHGRGVATRALCLLAEWAFAETSLARLELAVMPGNDASLRVAERAGFQVEGRLRSILDQRGVRRDGIMCSRLPTDPSPSLPPPPSARPTPPGRD